MESELPVFCERCSTELTPGRGDFYVVKVEAYAEAGPVVITEEDLAGDQEKKMGEILESMEGISAQEAMDAVHRRLHFHLCRSCYRAWIEKPAGGDGGL